MKPAIDRRTLMLLSGSAALCATPATATPAADKAPPRLLYENALAKASDIDGFRLEGSAKIDFDTGRMVMENTRPREDGQAANYVLWCPETFPADIEISWEFRPLREPGLCILFFGARGIVDGKLVSIFDKRLAPRQGLYDQYNNSDISYLSLSYFRRQWADERALQLVNLRAAPGFEMLAQGADPIPSVENIRAPYDMVVRRLGRRVTMTINKLTVLDWTAPADRVFARDGQIGFRQMAPLRAEYANLKVYAL
jgi:hypothetical protein